MVAVAIVVICAVIAVVALTAYLSAPASNTVSGAGVSIAPAATDPHPGVTVRDSHGITILEVTNWSIEELTLYRVVDDALRAGQKRIVIDLAKVKIKAFGLATLCDVVRKAREAGAEIKLISLSPRVDEVLKITEVAPTMDIYSDEAAATASFSSTEAPTRNPSSAPRT